MIRILPNPERDRLVLLGIWRHQSFRAIAADLGKSIGTVQQVVAKLVEDGYITKGPVEDGYITKGPVDSTWKRVYSVTEKGEEKLRNDHLIG